MAHVCHPGYSGDGDWENDSSKSAWADVNKNLFCSTSQDWWYMPMAPATH
jgi:hypothetical protein